jgi:hypothetical protein
LISKYKVLILAGVIAASALVGCDKNRCVRNSNCEQLFVCVEGYCVVKPLDGSVSTEDGSAGTSQDAGVDQAKAAVDGAVDAAVDAATTDSGQ